ncbi:hypothetical protein SAMN02927914_02501 [Mesorhizobium qingshengii]|uniref:Uncharacterized protein n=1 Tax=Mesorhizobium qingshengii TaxID=1165689 RepID=A0A1G5XPL0_9HYPH|nr:hypothetical protein SAMN02927914_02501 [Mesorhizobium qingshengii]
MVRPPRAMLFQKVKIPREICFGPCQIALEREGNTLLADVACLPANRAGGRCVTEKITDRVWIT